MKTLNVLSFCILLILIFTSCSKDECTEKKLLNQVGIWEGNFIYQQFYSDTLNRESEYDLTLEIKGDETGILTNSNRFIDEEIEWNILLNAKDELSIDIIREAFNLETGESYHVIENYTILVNEPSYQEWESKRIYINYNTLEEIGYHTKKFTLTKI